MKHELIKTENYLLDVDESEIKDDVWHLDNGVIKKWKGNLHSNRLTSKKIIYHLPLNNAPTLEGVSLLPPLEDDVKKLSLINAKTSIKGHKEQDINTEIWISGARQIGFKEGYNKAKEKYKYTEEDLRFAIKSAFMQGVERVPYLHQLEDNIIKAIRQPKYPVGFESKDELYMYSINGDIMKPKTTTNSQGQTVLVGTYKYK
jgi:hypothetical protein